LVDTTTRVVRGGCYVNQLFVIVVMTMQNERLSPHELRVWHAFKLMGEDVLSRVERDLTEAVGLSGPEFGVLLRLAGLGKGEMRQQALAECLEWDKSRLSHQLTRMQRRDLIIRHESGERSVLVLITKLGRQTLDTAMPIHAASVRRHLLSRLTPEQIATMVRVSNILGDDE
jgi:DNA-binding MarR family transcriptional regulator